MGRTGGGVFNVTAKSGTNSFHGTGFFQTRPIWGQTNNYFSQIAATLRRHGRYQDGGANAKPNSPYYLGGGGFGGPIVKDRTFFWVSNEQYHDVQTRNSAARMPTAAERAGDFSRLTNSCRPAGDHLRPADASLPFPGNVIPANRINPVAAAMIKYMPLPDTNVDNGSTNYNRTSLINNNFETEITAKVEHKFSDKVSLTGFYLYNRPTSRAQNYFGTADQTEPNRFADPNDYILVRRPQLLALNNTWVLSDSSVMSLRFGLTRFPDNNTLSIPLRPLVARLHRRTSSDPSPSRSSRRCRSRDYDPDFAGRSLGAINPTADQLEIDERQRARTRSFFGSHTFKFGGDFRKIGVDTYIPGDGSGCFYFDKEFTSANGSNSNATVGQRRRVVPARLSRRRTRATPASSRCRRR